MEQVQIEYWEMDIKKVDVFSFLIGEVEGFMRQVELKPGQSKKF